MVRFGALEQSERLPRGSDWADIGNLHVDEDYRRRGVATWLVAHAVEWLGLAHVDRLFAYAWPEEEQCVAFLEHAGFQELTRTERGWVRATVVDARAAVDRDDQRDTPPQASSCGRHV